MQNGLNVGLDLLREGLICCLLLPRQRVQAGSLVFPAGPFQVLQYRSGSGSEKEAGLLFAAFRVFQILCPEKPLADGLLQGLRSRKASQRMPVPARMSGLTCIRSLPSFWDPGRIAGGTAPSPAASSRNL